MKLKIEVPEISTCGATPCSYNAAGRCHARAITVGNGTAPAHCNTFFAANSHVAAETPAGGVGACKVATCRFNKEFECMADAIDVALRGEHADCATYAR